MGRPAHLFQRREPSLPQGDAPLGMFFQVITTGHQHVHDFARNHRAVEQIHRAQRQQLGPVRFISHHRVHRSRLERLQMFLHGQIDGRDIFHGEAGVLQGAGQRVGLDRADLHGDAFALQFRQAFDSRTGE